MLLAAILAGAMFNAEPLPPLPPVQFDKPYAGKLQMVVVPWQEVHYQCTGSRQAIFGHWVKACAMGDEKECVIIFPSGGPSKEYLQRLFRHERGHCNGWPADHPNARP